jgi:serine/threonine-protein kinase SRK2
MGDVQVLQRVIRGDYVFPRNFPISDECKDLLSKILVVDPEKRLTVQQVQQHPWWVAPLLLSCSCTFTGHFRI